MDQVVLIGYLLSMTNMLQHQQGMIQGSNTPLSAATVLRIASTDSTPTSYGSESTFTSTTGP